MAFSDFNPPLEAQTYDENGNPVLWDESTKWEWIRFWRNAALAKCDWTQIPDNGMSDERRNAWKEYRQQLRDITNVLSPEDAVPPTPPGDS